LSASRLALLLPALLLGTACLAQEVTSDTATDLWCGIALTLATRDVPADAAPEVLKEVGPYKTGAELLMGRAKSAHLEAGYTEEAFVAYLATQEAEVIKELASTDPAIAPPHSFEDCAALIGL
jgi:hypothetical protein